MQEVPRLVYADDQGNIYDAPEIEAAGRSGIEIKRLSYDMFIPMPEGSVLHFLPERNPIGFDRKTGEKIVFKGGTAVSAFIAPAHTQYYLSAYHKEAHAPRLPLFSYTAVGWFDGSFYVPAIRIDPDIRQDCDQFNQNIVEKNVSHFIDAYPSNRLIKHLAQNCALEYFCPAARNFFLKRWEAPLPTSPACNSKCLGCISYQPKETEVTSPQDRIGFIPSPEEIAEVALMHLENAPDPIVSFGQGCEGEPLLVTEVIRDSIKLIRKKCDKGIINLNTNGSLPDAVEMLVKAGLNSVRISLNSVREEVYKKYFNPIDYTFQDVLESLNIIRKYKKWASINYFIFPGVTDDREEYNALKNFIRNTKINMIQWRNFNIDPDWYCKEIEQYICSDTLSMKKLMSLAKEDFPDLTHGYFNPPSKFIRSHYKDFL